MRTLENGSSLQLKLEFKNTMSQLVIWAAERGLPTPGTKTALTARLREWCRDHWTGPNYEHQAH